MKIIGIAEHERRKKISDALKGKSKSESHRTNIKNSNNSGRFKKGLIPHNKKSWEETNYRQKHMRMRKMKRNVNQFPDHCENCNKINCRLELSNIDHKYSEKLEDYQVLCKSCHLKYDFKMGLRPTPVTSFKKGHIPWNKNKKEEITCV